MNLKKVIVTNLYGELNYDIEFNSSKRSTFLVGRNGSGKTTILKIIDSLSKGNVNYLLSIEYDEIELFFDNDLKITLQKTKDDKLKIITKGRHKKTETFKIKNETYDISSVDTLINKLISIKVLTKLNCGHWASKENSHITNKKEILDKYSHLAYIFPEKILANLNQWEVKFLSSERQLAEEESRKNNYKKKYKIEVIAESLKNRLQQSQTSVLKNIEKIGDDLEETLISKGLVGFGKKTSTQFQQDYEDYLEYRARLNDSNLSAGTDLESKLGRTLDENERALIDYIIKKRISAYEPYNDILDKLELFTEIINSALTRKKIEVKLPDGMNIITDSGDKFHPVHLSSGEQHVVVLAHVLLFEIESNGLALIDEPELSMDVDWQSRLSGWLDKVGDLCDLKFILATHSPLVLMGRDDSIKTLNA